MKDYKKWFESPDVVPYVFVREGNLPEKPGSVHKFKFPREPLVMDPFELRHSAFGSQILRLENRCFQSIGLTLPRWAFYDCSIMPGLVVGFAYRREKLPAAVKKILPVDNKLEFIPISLFICIPTAEKNHWVAHNLCSVSSILPPEARFPSLGFLTKAFGLWYFNIRHLYGMTQWGSQAIKVHSNYGEFRVVSAYNEIHDYPETLTYLVRVQAPRWREFLQVQRGGGNRRQPSSYVIHPKDRRSMKALHAALERGEGPFYLNGKDFLRGETEDQIQVYL
jgi:hypothetical protein